MDILKDFKKCSIFQLEEHVKDILHKYDRKNAFIYATELVNYSNSFLESLTLIDAEREEQKKKVLAEYKVGKFVRYVNENKTNKHLFTLDKEYRIIESNAYIHRDYGCFVNYFLIDNTGVKRRYSNLRNGSFVLI